MLTNDLYKKAYLRSLGLISEEAETEQPAENAVVKQVCFKTSDEALLALLDKGIKEIVIKIEDENGEEVEETFAIDSFGDLEVSEIEEKDEEEVEECGTEVEEDEELEEEKEELEEEENEEDAELEEENEEDEELEEEEELEKCNCKRFSKYTR
jgi:hypothetical protein